MTLQALMSAPGKAFSRDDLLSHVYERGETVIDRVVDDPEAIRQMARDNGPYWQPGRTIATSKSAIAVADNDGDDADSDFADAMVGPTFRGQWAFGDPMIDGADALLDHVGFHDAARRMYGWAVVVHEQVYVNLTTPIGRQGVSHTDIPEFRGVDRRNTPAWPLTANAARPT